MITNLLLMGLLGTTLAAQPVWIEGEDAIRAEVSRHPWYHGQVKQAKLSGGNFLSHFDDEREGRASYEFEIAKAGKRELWIRANPVKSRMLYQLDDGAEAAVDFNRGSTGQVNLASDDKPDLRFMAWCRVGTFQLAAGKHRLRFRFASKLSHHGSIDCFVLAPPGFKPAGTLKPGEIERYRTQLAKGADGWLPWISQGAGETRISLRGLNENFAGENGRIVVNGPDFVHEKTGGKVRFWAVNGPPHNLRGEELAACARMLAERGVNLVRLHGKVFDEATGELDRAKVEHIHEVVAAMKREGIYSHLSIYFPLWMKPKPGPGWREGYNGKQHPFALIFFEPGFQLLYREWLTVVLEGLLDEPAVFGVELVNEDSLFFWTFAAKNIPDPQLRKLEKRFAEWAVAKHGSMQQAIAAWGGMTHPRDGDGRLGFRGLWKMVNQRKPRDRDTAAFLLEVQRGFYQETTAWLRKRGFKGLVTASNWHTADAALLGPLERYSYTVGDFIDRHGYFGCGHKGDNAAWSVRDGHTYADRSSLRFEGLKQGRSFAHPVVDLEINGMPSMISETTYNRPNRYRFEAPWVYAAYGSLQGTDAIVHFALDSHEWSVKPRFFMQPWTLMSPTQAGQFPAAAAVYRMGLLQEGGVVAEAALSLEDAVALKGSPLAPAANLDELREADVPEAGQRRAGGIDPRVHFLGRTQLTVGKEKSRMAKVVAGGIDPSGERLISTTRELALDYGKGVLRLRAPAVQGAVGALAGERLDFPDLKIRTPMVAGAVVAVALDGKRIRDSKRILVQVMSEEKANGFRTTDLGGGRKRIESIGNNPWMVRQFAGEVELLRSDAGGLRVEVLDRDGRLVESRTGAEKLELSGAFPYLLITSP